ncbi:MAG TPA: hypothetical protein VN025_01755 [Candidatus Dormibacteraeota bacterium]|jgi:hypothetical protein|nr:hypothetical protein [Candidatus Dormibacteraeota bacterium]
MKRFISTIAVVVLCTCFSSVSMAQFGANLFRKPNIADVFHPVVGQGAYYEEQHKDGTKSVMEMSVLGKETVDDGQEAYWVQFGRGDSGSDQLKYSKLLITKEKFEVKRMIFMSPKSSQLMEFPVPQSQVAKQKAEEEKEKWHQVGTEPVTVPAGTFLCQHWAKDDGSEEIWASSKVSPLSMVKSKRGDTTTVLVKVISGATDHLPGTPQKFDPRAMMQQRMQQNQNQ